ncbi:DUF4131 domain-containing protein, partial [Longispora sp. NPDC051575]|uniref:DUF4131 domain-containing protein n=1 Tax=Longispora sp. NPDC051575 TaxID=3154943 RepID=UPI0034273A6C
MTAPVDGFPVGSAGSGGRAGRHDLRLGGAALGTWLMSWAALSLPWWVSALAAAGALVACAGLCRSRARAATVLTAVLLGVACGGLATAGRTVTRDSPAVEKVIRGRVPVPVELVVSDDPRLMRSGRGYVLAADLVHIAGSAGRVVASGGRADGSPVPVGSWGGVSSSGVDGPPVGLVLDSAGPGDGSPAVWRRAGPTVVDGSGDAGALDLAGGVGARDLDWGVGVPVLNGGAAVRDLAGSAVHGLNDGAGVRGLAEGAAVHGLNNGGAAREL